MKYVCIGTAALALLSACGDGSKSSNSGSAVPGFTSFSAMGTSGDGTYRANGMALSTSYVTDAEGNVTSVGAPVLDRNITTDLTYAGGELTGATIRTSKGTITLSTANGDTFDVTSIDGGFLATSADGDRFLVAADPFQQGYEYQTFGTWQTGMTGTSRVAGAGSVGSRTSASQMPATGSASYYGDSLGQVITDGQVAVTTSYIAVDTPDFSTVEIYSSDTITADPLTGAKIADRADLDFYAAGTVSGTGFAADIDTGVLTGAVDGQFYGSNAQEVGGTFSGTTADSTYIGAFGAVDVSR
ncbi:transferrin-binding protein-like solute binding protein [Salipiger mangrovisoli]|uniref:Transferrin-binding protein-like solute binding protein n=1 Tax=Salipiger mangrovisoli TaxID=2865933 RepID=A0ABR9X8U3_9RHOB|nr:transferrin-binding protein-like solute binding protein [Salipiger mangrovisoli]MBE9639957.1 transferrin-binding protein-like solute binding protein [Salipiger mangrovisoli]